MHVERQALGVVDLDDVVVSPQHPFEAGLGIEIDLFTQGCPKGGVLMLWA